MNCPGDSGDRLVAAILARALTEPTFAADLPFAAQGSAMSKFGDEDRRRLVSFAGLITKVRYNSDLFEHLPWTLTLLRRHQVEVAVFRDYYLTGAARTKDPSAKVSRMLCHLEHFADSGKGRAIVGLRDVLKHERVLWELRQRLEERPARRPKDADIWTAGPCRVVTIDSDPWSVMKGAVAQPCRTYRLYWVSPEKHEIRSVALSRRTARVARAASVPGRLSEVLARLRTKDMSIQGAMRRLRALASLGVLSIRG